MPKTSFPYSANAFRSGWNMEFNSKGAIRYNKEMNIAKYEVNQ